MVTPSFRLAMLRAALNQLLARPDRAAPLGHALGLGEDAVRGLLWFIQEPRPGIAFQLAFADSCPGSQLPRRLRCPDGGALGVHAMRGGATAQAQSWLRVCNATHPGLKGTLSAILRDPGHGGQLLALTAGHVMAADRNTTPGDEVLLQPDAGDSLAVRGRLLDWRPRFTADAPVTTIDAGLAVLETGDVGALLALDSLWPVGSAPPYKGDRLHLHTRNAVIDGGNPVLMSARLCVDNDSTMVYTIEDALAWRTDSPTLGGDSGAPIWNDDDALVAIHAGRAPEGSDWNAVAVPIDRILGWAGAEVLRRGAALQQSAPDRVSHQVLQASTDERAMPDGLQVDTLARTMWGEARGEPDATLAMRAVGHVVLNRVERQTYWGHTVEDVCRKPWQFSCWNKADPNLPWLRTVTSADARYATALQLTADLLRLDDAQRHRADPTAGATHYYARRIPTPRWALGHQACARIGGHDFFNDIA